LSVQSSIRGRSGRTRSCAVELQLDQEGGAARTVVGDRQLAVEPLHDLAADRQAEPDTALHRGPAAEKFREDALTVGFWNPGAVVRDARLVVITPRDTRHGDLRLVARIVLDGIGDE